MTALRRSLCVLLAALAAGVRAEDKSAPPAAAGDDSIAAAKRDFDTIKATRAPLEQQRLDLPQMSAPTLHLGSDEMTVFLQGESDKKKEQDRRKAKSANWLVDAMMKPAETTNNPKAGAAVVPADADADHATSLVTLDAEEQSRSAQKLSTETPKAAPTVDNPLNNYMATWMTPKDLDLLKVKPADTNLPGPTTAATDRAPDSGLLDGLVPGDASASAGRPPAAAGSGSPDAQSNPYLADFGPNATTGPKEMINLPASVPISIAPLLQPAVPSRTDPAPAKADTPASEILKPSTDSKYFPQLKRF